MPYGYVDRILLENIVGVISSLVCQAYNRPRHNAACTTKVLESFRASVDAFLSSLENVQNLTKFDSDIKSPAASLIAYFARMSEYPFETTSMETFSTRLESGALLCVPEEMMPSEYLRAFDISNTETVSEYEAALLSGGAIPTGNKLESFCEDLVRREDFFFRMDGTYLISRMELSNPKSLLFYRAIRFTDGKICLKLRHAPALTTVQILR